MAKKIRKGLKKGGKMLMCAMVVLMACVIAVPAFAQDVVKLDGLNLSGDTLYLPSSGTFAVGAGSDIATIYDFVTVRAIAATPFDNSGIRYGAGVGVNIPKLIEKAGGTWIINTINSSVGVTALANLNGKAHVEPAIFLSLIKLAY